MDIIVDFDGTVVTHDYPFIGMDIGAVPVLKKLVDHGHRLILFTMRSDLFLVQAKKWLKDRGVELYGVQTNPEQKSWTTSPKAYGQLIIDDAALGCPLIFPQGERPYVDWVAAEKMLEKMGLFKLEEK